MISEYFIFIPKRRPRFIPLQTASMSRPTNCVIHYIINHQKIQEITIIKRKKSSTLYDYMNIL